MDYRDIRREDRDVFHDLMRAYYREGEDADTPQEELDAFISLLFGKVIDGEIRGCIATDAGNAVGFALWAEDTETFTFSQMPGLGTILEIGLIPSYRGSGYGKALAAHVEDWFATQWIRQCYVCAYAPARAFWERCGYVDCGRTGSNGLPILVKTISP